MLLDAVDANDREMLSLPIFPSFHLPAIRETAVTDTNLMMMKCFGSMCHAGEVESRIMEVEVAILGKTEVGIPVPYQPQRGPSRRDGDI
jgi:hypothetical protein